MKQIITNMTKNFLLNNKTSETNSNKNIRFQQANLPSVNNMFLAF